MTPLDREALDVAGEAQRRRAAEARIRRMVDEDFLRDFSRLPVGERLGVQHFRLAGSVSPLAISAAQGLVG